MKPLKARFPFLILPERRKNLSDRGAFSGKNYLRYIRRMLEGLDGQNDDLRKKLSHLLEETALLESALEDLPERSTGKDGEAEIQSFFSRFIPVLDGLDSMRKMIIESGKKEWQEGISIFYSKLLSLCEAHKLKRSAEVGMAFDPSLHEAVGTTSGHDLAEGSIAEIIEHGWLYRGKTLRFAKVLVEKEYFDGEDIRDRSWNNQL